MGFGGAGKVKNSPQPNACLVLLCPRAGASFNISSSEPQVPSKPGEEIRAGQGFPAFYDAAEDGCFKSLDEIPISSFERDPFRAVPDLKENSRAQEMPCGCHGSLLESFRRKGEVECRSPSVYSQTESASSHSKQTEGNSESNRAILKINSSTRNELRCQTRKMIVCLELGRANGVDGREWS